MGRKDNLGARAGAIKLEAWALTHSPQFLADIDATEEQIAAGTMTPLDETLDQLAAYGPEHLEEDIQEFARAEAYEDDPLRSTMRRDAIEGEPAHPGFDSGPGEASDGTMSEILTEIGDRDRIWKLFLAHEKELADAGDEENIVDLSVEDLRAAFLGIFGADVVARIEDIAASSLVGPELAGIIRDFVDNLELEDDEDASLLAIMDDEGEPTGLWRLEVSVPSEESKKEMTLDEVAAVILSPQDLTQFKIDQALYEAQQQACPNEQPGPQSAH